MSTKHDRRSRFSILAIGVFLSQCSGLIGEEVEPITPAAADLTFEQYEVVTGSSKRQTVLTAFLLGGASAELAVVHIDENDSRRLRIYAFGDGTWVPRPDATLRPDVLFVDVANIGGRDLLITYERGRLNWFDPDSATERSLAAVATNYNATEEDEIPHVDITRDVNRDGRDDLVVPDVDGFWIATQSSDGSFTDPVKLGPPEPFLEEISLEEKRSYGAMGISARTIPWYLSRVHELDYDHDGRSDLVFWNEDHFDVHLQDERGAFDPVPKAFTTDVPFDSDGVYSHIFGFSGASELSLFLGTRKRSKWTVLHSFRDVNGDGIADLVTQSLEGRSLLRQRIRLAVHYGTPTPAGTQFAREASTAIQPRGSTASGYQTQELRDFDGDGQVEIVHGRVDTGIGQMFRALVGNSITMDIEFYRIKDGLYPDQPNATRKIRPDVHVLDRRGPFFPTVLAGDVNGDGRLDLSVGQSWQELRIFIGVPGPDLLARKPQKVEVALTANERNTRLVDLNGDSKQDLLIYHPSTTEPHRVVMLIAR